MKNYDLDALDYSLIFLVWVLIFVSIVEITREGSSIAYIIIILGLVFQLVILRTKRIKK